MNLIKINFWGVQDTHFEENKNYPFLNTECPLRKERRGENPRTKKWGQYYRVSLQESPRFGKESNTYSTSFLRILLQIQKMSIAQLFSGVQKVELMNENREYISFLSILQNKSPFKSNFLCLNMCVPDLDLVFISVYHTHTFCMSFTHTFALLKIF